ncbi:MAG: hypothetical protein JWN94_3066 [Betaproteobacteria bacterium]|nr:hypothetical protein [Betaproteobacteria bacterium]
MASMCSQSGCPAANRFAALVAYARCTLTVPRSIASENRASTALKRRPAAFGHDRSRERSGCAPAARKVSTRRSLRGRAREGPARSHRRQRRSLLLRCLRAIAQNFRLGGIQRLLQIMLARGRRPHLASPHIRTRFVRLLRRHAGRFDDVADLFGLVAAKCVKLGTAAADQIKTETFQLLAELRIFD